jgi:hypothetical protein
MLVNGVPARIWRGKTAEKGTAIEALIVIVKVRSGDDLSEFDGQLDEIRKFAGKNERQEQA